MIPQPHMKTLLALVAIESWRDHWRKVEPKIQHMKTLLASVAHGSVELDRPTHVEVRIDRHTWDAIQAWDKENRDER